MRFPPLALPLVVTIACACAAPSGLAGLPRPERAAKIADDARALRLLISGLEDTMARARAAGLLGLADDTAGAVAARTQLKVFFATFLDYLVALDAVRAFYDARGGLGEVESAEAFLIAYAADLAMYVNTAELLSQATGHRSYEALFDEPTPELGIPEGAWRRVKTAFNLSPWQRPLVLAQTHHRWLADRYHKHGIDGRQAWLFDYVERRAGDMVRLGATAAPGVVIREWGDLIAAGFQRVWFPAQKGIAGWMGDTRVKRIGQSLIARAQIETMRPHLQPGDLLVERRNWYLSNVGLPGFWPHAALYLGTPAELASALGTETVEHLRRDFPAAFADWSRARAPGDPPGDPLRVLESVSEGVIFSSLEHTASADYFGVFRPRLTPAEIALAITRAFTYAGRPYDFDFDFLSDQTLVCSELVYKAYEPQAGTRGLALPLVDILGRPTLPPNEIVRLFDAEADRRDRQLDFVYFLDGSEHDGRAVVGTAAELRASWRRAKWDLAQK